MFVELAFGGEFLLTLITSNTRLLTVNFYQVASLVWMGSGEETEGEGEEEREGGGGKESRKLEDEDGKEEKGESLILSEMNVTPYSVQTDPYCKMRTEKGPKSLAKPPTPQCSRNLAI